MLSRFKQDTSGTIAVWMALMAFPLLMAATYAIDVQAARTHRVAIETAIDSATLAAVLNNSLSLSEKESFARDQFLTNFSGDPDTLRDVQADATQLSVTLRVTADYPFQLSFLTTRQASVVKASGRAETTHEDTVCVLALNSRNKEAIRFDEHVEFLAPTCSVQANSRSAEAIKVSSSVVPQARGFCATGGIEGSLYPPGKSECFPISDPYATTNHPVPGLCEPEVNFTRVPLPMPAWGGDDDDDDDYDIDYDEVIEVADDRGVDPLAVPVDADDSENVVVDNVVLKPGTYCGGLTIAGRNVTLLPGEYIMLDGPFAIKDGAKIRANRVLVALQGKDAKLKVEDGASLTITAPEHGERAGLAFMGKPDARSKKQKSEKSRIDDGSLNVTGTVYLPHHKLEIKGSGTSVGAQAPATSFIVDTIRFKGSGRIVVDVDHLAANLPPIRPRSDEGARITR